MQSHNAFAHLEEVGPAPPELLSCAYRPNQHNTPLLPPPWMFSSEPFVPHAELREPISGALYEERRVYTRNEGEKWKFWGIQEDGMTLKEFWSKYDPENTRGDDDPNNDYEPDIDTDEDLPEITSHHRRPAHHRSRYIVGNPLQSFNHRL